MSIDQKLPRGCCEVIYACCTQNADAQLLHARLQRGPTQAEEGCGSVGTGNLPNRFSESGNDFLPFGFLESCPQIPVAVTTDWRPIDTKLQFFRGQIENQSGRDDDCSLDEVLQC